MSRTPTQFADAEASSALLTNFEVLELLRNRGAMGEPDLAGSGMGATPSECQVYEYLSTAPAATQDRECVSAIMKKIDEYNLTKAEKLQIVNLRPASAVEIHLVVEDCDERLSSDKVDQLVETISEILPAPPMQEEEAEAEEVEPGA